jgi:uncharacterized protein involved in type VI secretion and phage assembly
MTIGTRIAGVTFATVTDRDNFGRVKLNYPWLDASVSSDWVPVAAPMSGNGRGLHMMPEVGDEAVVGFDHGDFDHPVVLGFLWNGVDQPPSADARERIIASKNGHKIHFVDSTPVNGDKGALIMEDANGNVITLSNGKIAIHAVGLLEIQGAIVTINGRVVQPSPNPI